MPSDPNSSTPPPSPYTPDWIRTYKIVNDVELTAHGFLPKAGRPGDRKTAYAFFHPGGWSTGEPAWGYGFCHHYAGLGMVAVSFQYRLSSPGGYTPVDATCDVRSAVRWARQQADELGIDADRLVVGGVSAGAHLALCATMLNGPDSPGEDTTISVAPNALALQCAVVDSASDSQFRELMQGRDEPGAYSPANHVRSGLPPICLVHGTGDEIVPYESAKQFVAAMQHAGNICELHAFQGADHFFRNQSDQIGAVRAMDGFLMTLGYVERK